MSARMDVDSMKGAFPRTVRVCGDGGLLSHLTVRENLYLPLEYHGRDTGHVAEDAAMLLALCGEDAQGSRRLLESYPDALSLYEQRLAVFVRALLAEPEMLELDDMDEGLSVEERAKVMHWPEVFRLRFPFRQMKAGRA